jgi:uncharacterized delta-60 repeat protein
VRPLRSLSLAVVLASAAVAVPATAAANIGDFDSAFGTGGVVLSDFSATDAPVTVGFGAAVAPDGDIYQVGEANSSNNHGELFLARFLPNGASDHSFGAGGVVTRQFAPAGGNTIGQQVVILPSGNVVVEATTGATQFAIAEFTSAGVLDTSFAPRSSRPGVFFDHQNVAHEQKVTAAMALQHDGKIVLTIDVGTGTSPTMITGGDAYVKRLRANGTPDLGFASGGTYTEPVPAGASSVNASAPIVDSAGRIVFPLQIETSSGPTAMTLDSLSSSGVESPGFPASLQTSKVTPTPSSTAFAVLQAPDGDYVAAGWADVDGAGGTGEQLAAAAIKPNGAPDMAFGGKGTGGVTFGPVGIEVPTTILRQTDGRFLLVGFSGTLVGVAPAIGRLLPAGTVDPSFGVGGYASPSVPYEVDLWNAALSVDGQLLVSGQATMPQSSEAFLGKVSLDVPPRLAFTFGPAAPVVGQRVNFAAAAIGASASPTVTWDFGSGSFTTTGRTVTHTFTSPGRYRVRARATDAYGESTIDTRIVTVAPAAASVKECTHSPTPTVAVTSRLLVGDGLVMAGSSAAQCPKAVKSVGIAIARVRGGRCSFLSTGHRWGRYGGCKPKSYLPASGTYSWAFALVLKFVKGAYWAWERAVDSGGVATPNTPGQHITLRARGHGG